MKQIKRYQNCTFFEKRWRDRWNILIPFITIYYFISNKRVYLDKVKNNKIVHTSDYEIIDFKTCYSIACGDIDYKKNHYYTNDEIKNILKEKYKKYLNDN